LVSYEVIAAWIAKWDDHFVEPAVFGTINPHLIADLIDIFCQKVLGATVAEYLFYTSSMGAVCGVRLVDERRVVVKIHQASHSLGFLQAMVQVQRYLIAQGYPCTKPLIDPQPFGNGFATIEEFADEGVYHEDYNPKIRRSMAEALAQLIQLTMRPGAMPDLPLDVLDKRLPAGVIWPTPHSKLFNFEATAAGAEWIDEIAREAQEIKLRGAGQLVLGHVDWAVKHFRYIDKRISIIYDWDSLAFEKEPIIVGHAAGYFTYTEHFERSRQPTDEESRAFIAEYEIARGQPFTPEEHQTLNAAKLYELAYSARCEHALHPDETSYEEGSYRSLLAQYQR
jgi:hypothetical protein